MSSIADVERLEARIKQHHSIQSDTETLEILRLASKGRKQGKKEETMAGDYPPVYLIGPNWTRLR